MYSPSTSKRLSRRSHAGKDHFELKKDKDERLALYHNLRLVGILWSAKNSQGRGRHIGRSVEESLDASTEVVEVKRKDYMTGEWAVTSVIATCLSVGCFVGGVWTIWYFFFGAGKDDEMQSLVFLFPLMLFPMSLLFGYYAHRNVWFLLAALSMMGGVYVGRRSSRK